MEKSKIDLTMYGEDWVNTILDLQNAVDNADANSPYFVLYTWCIANEDDKIVTSSKWKGSDLCGLATAFVNLFKQDIKFIPIVATGISNYIKNLQEDERKRCLNEVIKILKG